MTKLNDWMVANNKSTADLAEVIHRDRTRAHRIRKGALPNKEEAPAIVEWTGGALVAGDFYDAESPTDDDFLVGGLNKNVKGHMAQSP